MNTKDYRLDVKSVSEEGEFEGMLSVYNVVDLGGDLVEPGAFTKTIEENSGTVPMLWQHDTTQPIGTLQLKETADGLAVRGKLILTVQRAREAYDLLKSGSIRGLSIGYQKIKHEMVKGVRHLKELKLYEGSIVTFPMLPVAQVTAIKADAKADFMSELELAQTYAMRHLMIESLCRSLDSILWSSEYDPESKVALSDESIEQFRESYTGFLPKLLSAWGEMKERPEAKAGRRLSASTRKEIEGAIAALMALLAEEEDTTAEKALPAAGPSEAEAAAHGSEPSQVHSLLQGFSLFGESIRAA